MQSSRYHDIVIIGAGPSSMGLIYALLSPYCRPTNPDSNRQEQHDKQMIPSYSIALIERGEGTTMTKVTSTSFEQDGATDQNQRTISTMIKQNNYHYDEIEDPKRWFQASHNPRSPTDDNDNVRHGYHCCSKVYNSAPQTAVNNRIMPIATGMGLGGGTNINACLVVRPSADDFDAWPAVWRTCQEKGVRKTTATANCESTCKMMEAVVRVEDEMMKNGALTVQPPLLRNDGGDDRGEEVKEENEQYENDNIFTKIDHSGMLPPFSTMKVNVTCAVQPIPKELKTGKSLYRRVNYYEALLAPLLEQNPHLRKILTIYSGVQAERIIMKEKVVQNGEGKLWEAKGVECSSVKLHSLIAGDCAHGRYFNVMAKSRVILCAGAILSPALLLVSGIGNPTELEGIGIIPLDSNIDGGTTIENRRWNAVGKQLRDHILVTKASLVPPNFLKGLNMSNGIRGWMALDIPVDYDEDEGEKNVNTPPSKCATARCFVKITDSRSIPWIGPHFFTSPLHREYASFNEFWIKCVYLIRALLTLVIQWRPVSYILTNFTAGMMLCVVNPESTGSITIRRKSNEAHTGKVGRIRDYNIIVDPGYLTNDMDMKRVISGCKVLNNLSVKWFSKYFELLPGPLYNYLNTSKDVRRYVGNFAIPYYHWSGSCAMEKKLSDDDEDNCPYFVVQDDLKVQGTENLYICDASVFPGNISAPISLTCAGLGYAAGTFVWKELIGKLN